MKNLSWRCGAGLLLTVLWLGAAVVAAEKPSNDWPQFRGNSLQNGNAASTLPDALDVRWKFTTKDSIESAAAVVGDFVYVTSTDGFLYALDRGTGKERWRYKAAPFKAAPSVREGRVYVGDTDGIFHCVSADAGKKLWTVETGGEIVSCANFRDNDVLFGSYADETLYCLSKDGKPRWKFKIGGPVNGSPAVAEGRTFVAGCDNILHVVDITTGKELAQVDLGGPSGASAAVDGSQLYVGTQNNEFFALDWKKGQILWKFEAPKRPQPFYSSAAITTRLAIVGSRDKNVYGIDRATGKQVWKVQTRGKVDSSPVISSGRAYVGSQDGNLYVLDAEKGTELSRMKLGTGILASPAIGDDCLVIGTEEGTVFCLGAKR